MFDATQSKFSRIQFERINVDQGDPRIQQYQVHGIPHTVFLDGGGKVLYTGSSWGSPDEFGQIVQSL